MSRVLVCGGRDFADADLLNSELDRIHDWSLDGPITSLIHGGARGADTLAGKWAKANGVPVRVFPANWQEHGRGAGHIRNQQMLDEGKPDLVVAFPGGAGTANMIQRARKAGARVIEVTP